MNHPTPISNLHKVLAHVGDNRWKHYVPYEVAQKLEVPKVNLEMSELYTVAAAHGYRTPLAMIDSLLGELKEWKENTEYILQKDQDVVRCCEGGGRESLVHSLCLTIIKTRLARDKAQTKQ